MAAGVLTACGDDGPIVTHAASRNDAPKPPVATVETLATAGAAEVVEVHALDNTFRPNRVVVAPGTDVRFVNRGRNDHNTLSITEGAWGVDDAGFRPGAEYTHRFAEPGEFPFYCSLHGTPDFGMIGVVVVEEGGG